MISTHILDTSIGKPAAHISLKLFAKVEGEWREIAFGQTNADGRHVFTVEKVPGIYQIIFEIEPYLKKNSTDYFFLNAPVVFKIEDVGRNYHVPLLLNPFGYSTYRGS